MARREVETLDRATWAVWDRKLGIVADVQKLARHRWSVEDYYSGIVAYFRTQSQAMHYAMQLPDEVQL
jgi:hypothetical protein